ncbi:MAG: cofactor-independent phosphoglycerate mutase [Geobacter sp.]|nr:MAG: cofactor-independent phosphoglycerate mutase [Geobacter sp.]
MKYIILLGDGMADYPLPDKGGKTPLELSRTPHMDRLAQNGVLGLVRTIPEGMDPGSDVANMAVLGYDPRKYYSGRAPIEAASMGLQLAPEDVAFRCNLVALQDRHDGTYMHDYSAGHITSDESHEIIRNLKETFDSETICFYPGVSYRHVMVWRRGSSTLTTTPPHDISDKKIDAYLPYGQGAGVLLDIMQHSRRILPSLNVNQSRVRKGQEPANAIWLWGQGRALKLPSFAETYSLHGSVISAVDLVKGLGISAGLQAISVPGATGYLDTNYSGKVSAALKALEVVDFVYLHVEAPDEASHKGSLQEKIREKLHFSPVRIL